jgi:hypothetical protein
LSSALGWALWWPLGYPSRTALTWLTVLWILAPLWLIGFWSEGLAAPLVAAVGAQVVAPLTLGPGVVEWPHLAIAAAAVVLGVVAGRLRSRARNESLGASE